MISPTVNYLFNNKMQRKQFNIYVHDETRKSIQAMSSEMDISPGRFVEILLQEHEERKKNGIRDTEANIIQGSQPPVIIYVFSQHTTIHSQELPNVQQVQQV